MRRYLAAIVILMSAVSLVLGTVFIVQGSSARAMLSEEMRAEKVTLGLPTESEEGYMDGNVVDTAKEAQAAQDILEEHLRDDYGTYGDTERNSPERTSYLDGITLRNSLNLAIMGFGVSEVIIVIGVFMIMMGIALGGTGLSLFRLARTTL